MKHLRLENWKLVIVVLTLMTAAFLGAMIPGRWMWSVVHRLLLGQDALSLRNEPGAARPDWITPAATLPCPNCPTCAPTATKRPTKTRTPAPTETPTSTPRPAVGGLQAPNPPDLLGVCQYVGSYGLQGLNWGYVAGNLVSARAVNPAPGVYDWGDPAKPGTLENAIAVATAKGGYFYAQVTFMWPTNLDELTPAWWGVRRLDAYGAGPDPRPDPFDPLLLERLRPVLVALNARIRAESACLGVYAGMLDYGETHINRTCTAAGVECSSDPTDKLVLAAAKRHNWTAQKMTEALVIYNETAGENYIWQHAVDYFLLTDYVIPMLDMYGEIFTDRPFVLQLGGGISWHSGTTAKDKTWGLASEAARYCVETYGARCQLKQNGLGNPTQNTYDSIFATYQGRTRTIYEGGWTDQFRDPLHNYYTMQGALDVAHVSALCLQKVILSNPSDYLMPSAYTYPVILGKLKRNFETYYLPAVQ